MNANWWVLLGALSGHALCAPFVQPMARILAAAGLVLLIAGVRRRAPLLLLACALGGLGAARLRALLPVEDAEALGGRWPATVELLSRRGAGGVDAWIGLDGRAHRALLYEVPDSLGPGSRLRVEADWWAPSPPRNPDDRDRRRAALARGSLLRGRVRSVDEVLRARSPGPRARVREAATRAWQEHLGASTVLWRALLLGESSQLEHDARERFARLGLAHLLALSGLHVGIVGGMLLLPLRRWGRRALPAVLPLLIAWAWVAGAGASLVRAVGMVAWWVVARASGRPARPLDALASLALLESTLRPTQLCSLGWWLSYAATAGILRILPALSGRRRWVSALLLSCTAQAATAPWTLDAFGRWVWAGAPIQLVVGLPFAVLLGLGAVLGSVALLLPPIAGPALALVSAGSHLFGWLLRLMEAHAPGPVGHPGLRDTWPLALLCLALWLPPWRGWRGARLGAVTLVLAAVHLPLMRGEQEIWTTLDVGQGDAGVFRRGRRALVVDAGPRSPNVDAGARVVLPFLERRNLGGVALAITHGHLDHLGGAGALLRSGRVATLVLAASDSGERWARHLVRHGAERRTQVVWASQGDTLRLGTSPVPVLWPPVTATLLHTNDRSLVLQVGPAHAPLLAAGDLEREGEQEILAALEGAGQRFAVLKVAHHGGNTGTEEPWLRRLGARWALVSCGRGNRYGHPHPDLLTRLRAARLEVLRTDVSGAIEVRWAGAHAPPRVRTLGSAGADGPP